VRFDFKRKYAHYLFARHVVAGEDAHATFSRPPFHQNLQYRAGPKKRGYRRIPLGKVGEVRRLLENGRRYRELASRYEALSARLALRFKKKA
jgi:hypothetical protein